jgi:hypothetical protein
MLFQNEIRRLLIPAESDEHEEGNHDQRADQSRGDGDPGQERVAHA